MIKRYELQNELKKIVKNVYFQPPSTLQLKYPCIVYSRDGRSLEHANDSTYLNHQKYKLLLIETDPDSMVVYRLIDTFEYCSEVSNFINDNLYHTTLNLTY